MSDWHPLGTQRHYRRPEVGMVIALNHTVWRVDQVQDLPLVDDADRQVWIDRRMPDLDTWDGRPYRVLVTPVGGVKKPLPLGRSYRIKVPAGAWSSWNVYPHDRWPQCSCCGEPMPCRAETEDLTVESAERRMAKMEARIPGCCWACEEPITSRQRSVVYAGMNLDLPTAEPARFHLRLKCLGSAQRYEDRWLAADPRRERILTYPRCEGTRRPRGRIERVPRRLGNLPRARDPRPRAHDELLSAEPRMPARVLSRRAPRLSPQPAAAAILGGDLMTSDEPTEREALTAERDHWRAMYEAIRAAAKAGIAARTTNPEETR